MNRFHDMVGGEKPTQLAGHHPPPVSQKVVAFLETPFQLEVLEGEREGGKGGQA